MFGIIHGTMMAMAKIEMAQELDRRFEDYIKDLPLDLQIEMRASRKEQQEKQCAEAAKERRHRELCQSIRSTSFWRFGA